MLIHFNQLLHPNIDESMKRELHYFCVIHKKASDPEKTPQAARRHRAQCERCVQGPDINVQTELGCFLSKLVLREIANDLDSGKYDRWIR